MSEGKRFGEAVVGEALEDGSIKWLKARRKGIGGSDAAVCLGMQPYGNTVEDLWEDKTGRVEPDDGNVATRYGSLVEDHIRDRVSWVPSEEFPEADTFAEAASLENQMWHHERTWQRANIDGLMVDGGGEILGGLEIKTSKYPFDSFDGDCKDTHYAQIQHYMAVIGLDRWWYAYFQIPSSNRRLMLQLHDYVVRDGDRDQFWEILANEGELTLRTIERSEAYIQNIIQQERDFWQYVEDDQRPEPVEKDGESNRDDDDALLELFNQMALAQDRKQRTDSVEVQEEAAADEQYAKQSIKQYLESLPGEPKRVVCEDHKATWNSRGYWMLYPADRQADMGGMFN